MDIKFRNEQNQIEVVNLSVDTKWKDVKANSIFLEFFNMIDDGDGIISESEINTVKDLLKEQDINKDDVVDLKEINDSLNYSKNYITARLIYNDIYEKNSIGFPTTGKDISKHIKKIDKDNVLSIISFYQNNCTNNKEDIFTGIMEERGLNINTRIKYIKHIFNALIDFYNSQGLYTDDIAEIFDNELNYQKESWSSADAERLKVLVDELCARYSGKSSSCQQENIQYNGKIDKDFKQGTTGDCWLLASIKAIAKQPKGSEILNNMIKVQTNGDVNVTLKGVNKTYKFTKQEIEAHTEYATGDLDVRIIEMAVNKYFEEERGVRGRADINGNMEHVAYSILTGKGHRNFLSDSYGRIPDMWFTDQQIDNFNKPNHVACVAANGNKETIHLKATNGSPAILKTGHAYTVSRSDSEYVYLINPWDSSTELPVDRKTFKEFFNAIDEFDL